MPAAASHPAGPTTSRYAASKAAGDALALRLAQQLPGLQACVVQLACVVGPDPKLLRPDDDTMRILPLMRGEASKGAQASAAVVGHVWIAPAAGGGGGGTSVG
jgi:nucleoside-diphosphate-sugar epimerase